MVALDSAETEIDPDAIVPSTEAVWWRDAFARGVVAAVSTSLAGVSGDPVSVRLVVSRPPAGISVDILAVASNATDRRRLQDSGAVISYSVSVTSANVLESNANGKQ